MKEAKDQARGKRQTLLLTLFGAAGLNLTRNIGSQTNRAMIGKMAQTIIGTCQSLKASRIGIAE